VSRILIHEPRRDGHDWSRLLPPGGHDVVVCTGREALFDAMTLHRPDLIIYVLGDLSLDLGVLWVVRHMSATLPIILLGGPTGIEARRSVQELRPVYFGVFPLDPAELSEAVRGALSHERRGVLAS
jgi:DNA-binding response OmpR family regulator